MDIRTTIRGLGRTALVAAFLFANVQGAQGAPYSIPDNPLFLNTASPPLNMLVMGRDHKLYYEAYNDASDLDGDGDLDAGYKPDVIDYYGYFDSFVCYDYDNSAGVFRPKSVNPSSGASRTKTCSGNWSGDFLNYLTTSRIDAMRKVLYGGLRSVDRDDGTIISRSQVPQDAHSWGKEYESPARDGYDISKYSPLALPAAGRRHLIANTTLVGTTQPRMRIVQNSTARIWNWVSKERPVADSTIDTVGLVLPTDYFVNVSVCEDGLISDVEKPNCQTYPAKGKKKPVGLLQKYGQDNSMLFGLLTGSYGRNTEGGVLRKNVGTITDEINASTGQFVTPPSSVGSVIATLNNLRTVGFNASYYYGDNCGWVVDRPINPGECRMWGNPVAEMMYETVRYFADKGSPTAAYVTGAVGTDDATLGLPTPSWQKPYSTASRCAKPFMTVISDINPSYDTNAIPGTAFGSFTGDLAGFNATTSTDVVSKGEGDINGTVRFIGESLTEDISFPAAATKGTPTPKRVGSLSTIRGLSPEEPTKQGGYYSAGIAYWANTNDVSPAAGRQRVQTFSVALASPLPRITIPFGDRTVTLVPFAKSVGGSAGGPTISAAQGAFQPTNGIVDFYYDTVLSDPPNRYHFRINYEDVEQGADHDMDAIVEYDVERTGANSLRVTANSNYAAGSIMQHMGYVISGTTQDGIYLEVRDNDTAAGSDPDYFLDTPPGVPAGTANGWKDGKALPLASVRDFTVGSTPGATLLKDPLWYAAKWGGFVDSNNNQLPDVASEWNQDGDPLGTPDNYFLVTNALKLSDQLSKAFDTILRRATSASSVALNSGSLSTDTRVYQAKFNSDGWVGQLLSFKIDPATGSVPATPEWDAAQNLPAPASRVILTRLTNATPAAFRWASLDATMQGLLQPTDALGSKRLDYLRGDGSFETTSSGQFRARPTKLGDIIASSPVFVGPPRFFYRDTLESKPYSAFRNAQLNRIPVVYAGANDGMLHGFNAGDPSKGGGQEVLAYVPRTVYRNLPALTDPTYTHKFFVDGSPTAVDAFINGDWRTVLVGGLGAGGQGIFALDVTDPSAFTEASPSSTVLWEFDDRDVDGVGPDSGDADMGLSYSKPVVVRLANGKWAAVFGNGYNSETADGSSSATGNAVLYIVDLATGQLIRKIDTGVGTAQAPALFVGKGNGLSSPTAVDLNQDNITDYIYAGDLYGNLWKFDVRSATPASWDVAYTSGSTKLPLFTARNAAGDPQPITSRPSVGRGRNGVGMLVLFGTGRYFDINDKDVSTLKLQSFYGLYDPNTGTTADRITLRTSLLQQQITAETTSDFGDTTYTLRTTTQGAPTAAQRGWYVDLQVVGKSFEGEMQVSDSILRSGRIIFATLIPSTDPCAAGGNGWLMSMDAMTGSAVTDATFDLNNDGVFDDADKVGSTSPSGIKSGLGIIQKPGVLADNQNNQNYLYASGTNGEKPCGIAGEANGAADSDACRGTRSRFGPFDTGRQAWRQVR